MADDDLPPMPPYAERVLWLVKPELQAFMLRYAKRRLGGDDAAAADVRQDACGVAMAILRREGGPRVEGEMPRWTSAIIKRRAHRWWRDNRQNEPTLPLDDVPELGAEDVREAANEARNLERLMNALDEALARHPEHAARVLPPREAEDGEARAKGPPVGGPERNRKSRSRAVLASAITLALAAALFLLLVRFAPDTLGVESASTFTSEKMAATTRELAYRHCNAREWKACLFQLDEAKRFDPAGDAEPDVQQARHRAEDGMGGPVTPAPSAPPWMDIAMLRKQALDECKAQHWAKCLDGLDFVRKYDPEGDQGPMVTLARRIAAEGLEGEAGTPEDMPAKEGFRPHRR